MALIFQYVGSVKEILLKKWNLKRLPCIISKREIPVIVSAMPYVALRTRGVGRGEVKELGEHIIIIIIRGEPKSACRCLISAR